MKKKRVFSAVATVTVFGVITRAISFLFKIYLSRALGAEAIGLYQMALSLFFLFASLSCGGIPTVLGRKVAERNAVGESDDYPIFTSALALGVAISLSCLVVLALTSKYMTFLFADESVLPIFLVLLPALLSTTVYSVVRGLFWGKKQFTAFSCTETIEEILRILFSVLFISGLFSGISGAMSVAIAFTVSDVLVAIILLVIFFAKGGKIKRPSSIKEIFLPSLPVTSMRVLSSLIATMLALILPLRLCSIGYTSAEATALFGRISGMANPLLLAPNTIISSLIIVLVPEMSANGARGEYKLLNKHLNTGINFSFLVSGIFLVAFLSLGKEITSFLYDDVISGEYLQYASMIILPTCLAQITQSALNSIGKEMRSFVNYLVGNAVMIVLVVILPRYIGIYAVAVGTFSSMLITSLLNVHSLRKLTSFDLSFLKYLFLVVIFVFPSAFLSDCIYSLFSGHASIFALFFSCLVGVVAYCILCVCCDLVDIRGVWKLRAKGN